MSAGPIIVLIAVLFFALLLFCTATGTDVNCSGEAGFKDGYPHAKGNFSTYSGGNKKNHKRI